MKALRTFAPSLLLFLTLISCNKPFKDSDYTAYFGGEVTNAATPYVLFCREGEVLDTIPLKKDGTFSIKFDSLTPGMYTFRNDPEYQYVYFDKNDSLMVHINSQDFDESIVFCGRGEQKNNFLMEMYLKNEYDKRKMFDVFEYDYPKFSKYVDSAYNAKMSFYNKRRTAIEWDDNFDKFAKASLDYNHYAKFELYPMVQKMRMGNDITKKLSPNYYDYRRKIDFNDPKLSNFSPFVNYISRMLNNMAMYKQKPQSSIEMEALEANVMKLNIADTLFKNKQIKNTALNNIAFSYLLEDQNMGNNKLFLDRYHQLSTDMSKHNEILQIGEAIKSLKKGSKLPVVNLINTQNQSVDINQLIKNKTVIFFWTESLESHLIAAHKKAIELEKKYPGLQFIAINVDKNHDKWTKTLNNYKFGGVTELRATNFEDLKKKWVITKIHRTMILNADGTIDNAFVSLFEANFEQHLE